MRIHPSTSPRRHGYTVIEIIVLIVMIGVLMKLIVPNFTASAGTRAEAAKTEMRSLAEALDAYKLDNDAYPSTQQGLEALITKPSGEPQAAHWKKGHYLKKMPADPWGNPYQYVSPGIHGAYDLYSLGHKGKPGQHDSESIIGQWQP